MTLIIDRSTGTPIPTYDIMVDYDDVVQPWASIVHEKCQELGLHDGSKTWSSWSMWEDYGCPKEEWENAVIAATADGLYTNVDPYVGAREALLRLLWSGHRIHIVTARGFMANGPAIRKWTEEHVTRYAVPYHTLSFSKNKAETMRDMDIVFDFAIDDSTKNYDILDAAGAGVWLATQPHNLADQRERRTSGLWDFSQMILNHQNAHQAALIAAEKEVP